MARLILTLSSGLLAVLGGGCLFFPEVSAGVLSLPPEAASALPLAGAGQLGFAGLNWIGRGAIYGGIYGRPIVLANFGNAVITGSAALRISWTPVRRWVGRWSPLWSCTRRGSPGWRSGRRSSRTERVRRSQGG